MLHFKCVTCRLRLAGHVAPQDGIATLCPGCGSPLEPVSELSEIVGFRAIGASRPSTTLADGHRLLAARVREVRAAAAKRPA